MVEYHHPVIRNGTVRVDLAPPPPFLQTCSEVGEERDEFSPIKISLPRDFFFFFLTICAIYTNMYRYLPRYRSPLGTSLLVDLLSSHDRSKMVELRVNPSHILQVELGEGIMRFPVAGC